METKDRASLWNFIKKIQKLLHKDPGNYKTGLMLKKLVEKHISTIPSDAVLRSYYTTMDATAFCRFVLSVDPTMPFPALESNGFSSGSAPATTKKKRSAKKSGNPMLEKIRNMLLEKKKHQVKYDNTIDPVPTETELAAQYCSVLHTVPFDTIDSLDGLLERVKACDTQPALLPLEQRLSVLFRTSLIRFLPIRDILSFLRHWDGFESSLVQWAADNRIKPICQILDDTNLTKNEKQAQLDPLLQFWSGTLQKGTLARLNVEHVEKLVKNLHLCDNIHTALASIDTGRRIVINDSQKKFCDSCSFYYGFWDLRWMSNDVSRVVVPMESFSVSLSEKQFASQYFDDSSYYEKETLFWCGKIPFRIEYICPDGSRIVQNEDMYRQHKQHCVEHGWAIPKHCLPRTELQVFLRMSQKWIMTAFTSFLNDGVYDIKMMATIIVKAIYKKSVVLGQFLELLYAIVGRLHPYFPMSKYHCVLKERIRHLYFHLDHLAELPLCLSFPEFFQLSKAKRCEANLLWHKYFELFQQSILRQCSHSSFRIPKTFVEKWFVPRSSLERNNHVLEDEQIVSLESVLPEYHCFFYDEDIVPGGLNSIGTLVECPVFYKPVSDSEIIIHDEKINDEEEDTEEDDDDDDECKDEETDDDEGQYDDESEDDDSVHEGEACDTD